MRRVLFFCLVSVLSCKTAKRPALADSPPLDTGEDHCYEPGELSLTPQDPASDQHVVLLLDDGIASDHEMFKDKVIAKYTLVCALSGTEDEMDSLEGFKAQAQERLKAGEKVLFGQKCCLRKGIDPLPIQIDPKDLDQRDQWNQLIQTNQAIPLSLNDLFSRIKPNIKDYHGTVTGSVIATNNPKVAFVLVQANNSRKFYNGCNVVQKNYEKGLANLQDSEIQKILNENAELSEWKLIDELAKKHHVTLMNKSRSTSTRFIDSILGRQCVEPFRNTISAYYDLKAGFTEKIARRMGIFYDQQNFLTLQSAGNDSLQIDSTKDSLDCLLSPKHLMIGSYDANGMKSYFSNFGQCVNIYNVGSSLVGTNPFGFLVVVSGTSFSAPLLARYISMQFPASMPALDIQTELKNRLNPNGYLPFDASFPYGQYTGISNLGLSEGAFSPVIVED